MRRTQPLITLLFGSLFLLADPAVGAEKLPLWEIGIGGGVSRIPDYRGAAEANTYPFPFVFPFYRGKIFRSDEEGVRGEVYKSKRVRFDFSIDGGVPVDSADNEVRKGMPDLDPTLQIGPALNIKLWQGARKDRSLVFFLPLRGVYALNSSGLDAVGYTFSPQMTYYHKVNFIDGKWKLGLTGGLEYGSDRFHDYYYGVDPQFATTTRSAFDADRGFAGYRIIWTFHHRFPTKWVSFFGRYDRIDGAVFEDSPLAVKKDGLTIGFLVTWFAGRSKKMVEVADWKYD